MKKIGIFGGRRGKALYCPILENEGFCVNAICEANPERNKAVRDFVSKDVAVFENWDEFISSGMDAVFLANTFHEHAKYAIEAMEKGIDVISETTAAPTLGECLDLVECCERTGRKYMLAANCSTMIAPLELMRVYRSGELGEVLYAEAEYCHGTDYDRTLELAPYETHWRRFIPGTYYNMHTLGALMTVTGAIPRRVCAMEINTKTCRERRNVLENKSTGAIALYTMDNGAVFRSTGCVNMQPSDNWYRISCEGGTIETVRQNENRILLRKNGCGVTEYDPPIVYTAREKTMGHGGADAKLGRQICEYLSGKEDDSILDIYRAVTLSMAGIYGLYSILDGKTYDIPDIRDKKAREVLRGDYRSPFPDREGKVTLPFGFCKK